MSVFFVYTGLEVGAGQWEASFCRGHLHLSPGATGLAAFGYWGALTAVRLGLALRTVPPQAVVRWGSGIGVLACAVIWWQPGVAVTVAAFAVLGGALAGVFPALIALTPVRLGDQRAHNVIAWQVGAAAAGGAGVSAVIGLLIGATSLAVLGPAITVLALILVGAELILGRLSPVRGLSAPPSGVRLRSYRAPGNHPAAGPRPRHPGSVETTSAPPETGPVPPRVPVRTRLDFWFDGVLLVAYTLVYSLGFTGLAVHEWLGLGIGLALLLHLTLHWDWVSPHHLQAARPRGQDQVIWLVNLALLSP